MSSGLKAHELMADDDQRPPIGARVKLNRHVYGHVAGAQGVVVRGGPKRGKVLVRFDDTGYQISIPHEALAPEDGGPGH